MLRFHRFQNLRNCPQHLVYYKWPSHDLVLCLPFNLTLDLCSPICLYCLGSLDNHLIKKLVSNLSNPVSPKEHCQCQRIQTNPLYELQHQTLNYDICEPSCYRNKSCYKASSTKVMTLALDSERSQPHDNTNYRDFPLFAWYLKFIYIQYKQRYFEIAVSFIILPAFSQVNSWPFVR